MMTPDTEESVRCSVSDCSCVCFKPGSDKFRSCDCCGHSWVVHALEKLQAHPTSSCGPVEVALPGLVFDLSSLVLYGAQAVPVRLKILLDRLYSILAPEQVAHILHTHGWSLGDYVRGYILQHPSGKALDRWMMATPEEELLIFKQFLRFGETRPIVELMRRQCLAAVSGASDPEPAPAPQSRQSHVTSLSELRGGSLRAFRNAREDSHSVAGVWRFEKISVAGGGDTMQHFENLPGGLSLLLPSRFPDSAFPCSVPPAEDLVPPLCRHRPGETQLRYRPGGDRSLPHTDPIQKQFKGGRRGRVCCGVCGKSFYDKGTLKIHYNAVHLKVKHLCTVPGCTMVFSSLRSRNRHSANPNPRLHTGPSRDAQNNNTQSEGHAREKVTCNTLWPQDNDARVHNLRHGYNPPLQTDPFTPDATYRMNLHPQGPPHPLTPGRMQSTASSLVSTHLHLLVPVTEKHLLSISTEGDVSTANCRRLDGRGDQRRRSPDPVSKKKPRKSSMPVKIEREKKNQEEEES